jgi:hypothetical protein
VGGGVGVGVGVGVVVGAGAGVGKVLATPTAANTNELRFVTVPSFSTPATRKQTRAPGASAPMPLSCVVASVVPFQSIGSVKDLETRQEPSAATSP